MTIQKRAHREILQHLLPKHSRIRVYDHVRKYGDWFFKEPLLRAFARADHVPCFAPADVLPYIKIHAEKIKKSGAEIGLVFTRSDIGAALSEIVRRHTMVLELRRESRFKETLYVWRKRVLVFKKAFSEPHEEERVVRIISFLGLSVGIKEKPEFGTADGGRMVVSFTASEHAQKRLALNLLSIEKFLEFAVNHLKVIYVTQHKEKDAVLKKLSELLRAKMTIVVTPDIKAAFTEIDRADYFFGSDSGLAHYAVKKRKLTFALFNSRHSGRDPLFNSSFYNHIVLMGDGDFASEAVFYLNNALLGKRTTALYEFIFNFLNYDNAIEKNSYSNEYKFWRYLFAITYTSAPVREEFEKYRSYKSGLIFDPDNLYEAEYKTIKPITGELFLRSPDFSGELMDILKRRLNEKKLGYLTIAAKNSSFFNEVALRRGVSDVDYLTVVGKLSSEERGLLYKDIVALLKKYSLSTELPHQLPIFINESAPRKLLPIVENGSMVFSPSIPDNPKNIEKYKAKIKVKIICGEISRTRMAALEREYADSPLFGKEFVAEIKRLYGDRRKFPAWQIFIRKIESVLSRVTNRDGSAKIILHMNEEADPAIREIIADLMGHGIVYLRGNLLYINWDLRRPQHNWFIPVHVAFKQRKTYGAISNKAYRNKIYGYGIFQKLLRLHEGKLSIREVIALLGSDSYLATCEAFAYLSARHGRNLPAPNTENRRAYIRNISSNCEEGMDKQVSLLGLLDGAWQNFSLQEQKLLSKYNLFSFASSHLPELSLDATNLFNLPHGAPVATMDASRIVDRFKSSFMRLLKELYLYNLIGDIALIDEKKKEILFSYFVRGRSLMEGSAHQRDEIETFLKKIPIKEALMMPDVLDDALSCLSHYGEKIHTGEHVSQYILRKVGNKELEAGRRGISGTLPLRAINKAGRELFARAWNTWKRSASYQILSSDKSFLGTLLWTHRGKKHPLFYFEQSKDSGSGDFLLAEKSFCQSVSMDSHNVIGSYATISIPEFLMNYQFLWESPPFAMSSYRELKIGETIAVNGKKYKVIKVIGEGNFSIIYEVRDQYGSKAALKHACIPVGQEFLIGKKLFLTSSRFVEYYDADIYRSYIIMELLRGQTLSHAGEVLTRRQLTEVCTACWIAYRKGASYGDTTPNNTMMTPTGIRLIDPHFFFQPRTAFLKDILGIFYLIYFSRHKGKRPVSYWNIRLKIITKEIVSYRELVAQLKENHEDDEDIKILESLSRKVLGRKVNSI